MILGYILHIENPINMDLDLNIPRDAWESIGIHNVMYSEYTYLEDGETRTGYAHRVRLSGIVCPKNIPKRDRRVVSSAMVRLREIVNRCGGNVKYRMLGVDVFDRIIIEIYDPCTMESINEILLQSSYSKVYKRYVKKTEKHGSHRKSSSGSQHSLKSGRSWNS